MEMVSKTANADILPDLHCQVNKNRHFSCKFSSLWRRGAGDVEVAVNSLGTIEGAKAFVQRSFGESKFARRS
jgi:hypothetical protein